MNRLKIILSESGVLHEMLLGAAFSNIIILIIGVIFSKNKGMAALGVLEGTLIAFFYIIHMAVTIDDAMCLDEKGAAAQMRKNMLIRYVIVCASVAAICYFRIGDPVTCIFSCLTIKAGAYLQPTVHRILNRSSEAESVDANMDESENGGKISE